MKVLTAALLLTISIAGQLAIAQTDSDAEDASADDSERYDDEIQVLGQMNTTQLGRAVERAKLDFWDAYNSLNEVDEFRMVCERVAPTGTHVKKLSCAPSYYLEASREMTERSVRSGGIGSRNSRSVANSLAKQKKEADAHMIALIEKHPALLQKWNYLLEANQTLERAKE